MDEKLVTLWSLLCLIEPKPIPDGLKDKDFWNQKFSNETDPLTKFQLILLSTLYKWNVNMGNSWLTMVLIIMKEKEWAPRMLHLFREIRKDYRNIFPIWKARKPHGSGWIKSSNENEEDAENKRVSNQDVLDN